ncbi:phosphonate transport system permease protein [Peptoclostridium litorale DSM 5388]|uniref:Phosphite transport system permease protein PtxC n=1 Tax=Peptoclostridium litorale DSM 5388 TaxID=1121324 RepID=A0A069RNG9_PEPLI|nr:ABC transporter permease subunit [Peptoclostridium litorale]KDR95732.1 phosphite transport system permease protein PtxC [Peptoclostridium litorale DSM 5388]SIO22414.1 phosphonate transport system permease protein [Peptoclostridium litorale DSM 5388]
MINRKNVKKHFKPDFVNTSVMIFFIIVFTSWFFIYKVDGADLSKLFSEKNSFHAKKFLNGLFGIGEESAAFKDPESWKSALSLTYETLQMSIMATGFASLGMFLTVLFAAKNHANGTLTLKREASGWILFWTARDIYVLTRAVPELIWAMMIIFVFKPGILPGAIALALHNFGILGKLCAEVIEDIDHRPISNLSSSGANALQMLFYGILPTVTPKFITFMLYRWEVIIRTTIVVGLVGAGGLGQQFKLSMSWFHYTDVTLLLICYLILVFAADIISEGLRKIAQ